MENRLVRTINSRRSSEDSDESIIRCKRRCRVISSESDVSGTTNNENTYESLNSQIIPNSSPVSKIVRKISLSSTDKYSHSTSGATSEEIVNDSKVDSTTGRIHSQVSDLSPTSSSSSSSITLEDYRYAKLYSSKTSDRCSSRTVVRKRGINVNETFQSALKNGCAVTRSSPTISSGKLSENKFHTSNSLDCKRIRKSVSNVKNPKNICEGKKSLQSTNQSICIVRPLITTDKNELRAKKKPSSNFKGSVQNLEKEHLPVPDCGTNMSTVSKKLRLRVKPKNAPPSLKCDTQRVSPKRPIKTNVAAEVKKPLASNKLSDNSVFKSPQVICLTRKSLPSSSDVCNNKRSRGNVSDEDGDDDILSLHAFTNDLFSPNIPGKTMSLSEAVANDSNKRMVSRNFYNSRGLLVIKNKTAENRNEDSSNVTKTCSIVQCNTGSQSNDQSVTKQVTKFNRIENESDSEDEDIVRKLTDTEDECEQDECDNEEEREAEDTLEQDELSSSAYRSDEDRPADGIDLCTDENKCDSSESRNSVEERTPRIYVTESLNIEKHCRNQNSSNINVSSFATDIDDVRQSSEPVAFQVPCEKLVPAKPSSTVTGRSTINNTCHTNSTNAIQQNRTYSADVNRVAVSSDREGVADSYNQYRKYSLRGRENTQSTDQQCTYPSRSHPSNQTNDDNDGTSRILIRQQSNTLRLPVQNVSSHGNASNRKRPLMNSGGTKTNEIKHNKSDVNEENSSSQLLVRIENTTNLNNTQVRDDRGRPAPPLNRPLKANVRGPIQKTFNLMDHRDELQKKLLLASLQQKQSRFDIELEDVSDEINEQDAELQINSLSKKRSLNSEEIRAKKINLNSNEESSFSVRSSTAENLSTNENDYSVPRSKQSRLPDNMCQNFDLPDREDELKTNWLMTNRNQIDSRFNENKNDDSRFNRNKNDEIVSSKWSKNHNNIQSTRSHNVTGRVESLEDSRKRFLVNCSDKESSLLQISRNQGSCNRFQNRNDFTAKNDEEFSMTQELMTKEELFGGKICDRFLRSRCEDVCNYLHCIPMNLQDRALNHKNQEIVKKIFGKIITSQSHLPFNLLVPLLQYYICIRDIVAILKLGKLLALKFYERSAKTSLWHKIIKFLQDELHVNYEQAISFILEKVFLSTDITYMNINDFLYKCLSKDCDIWAATSVLRRLSSYYIPLKFLTPLLKQCVESRPLDLERCKEVLTYLDSSLPVKIKRLSYSMYSQLVNIVKNAKVQTCPEDEDIPENFTFIKQVEGTKQPRSGPVYNLAEDNTNNDPSLPVNSSKVTPEFKHDLEQFHEHLRKFQVADVLNYIAKIENLDCLYNMANCYFKLNEWWNVSTYRGYLLYYIRNKHRFKAKEDTIINLFWTYVLWFVIFDRMRKSLWERAYLVFIEMKKYSLLYLTSELKVTSEGINFSSARRAIAIIEICLNAEKFYDCQEILDEFCLWADRSNWKLRSVPEDYNTLQKIIYCLLETLIRNINDNLSGIYAMEMFEKIINNNSSKITVYQQEIVGNHLEALMETALQHDLDNEVFRCFKKFSNVIDTRRITLKGIVYRALIVIASRMDEHNKDLNELFIDALYFNVYPEFKVSNRFLNIQTCWVIEEVRLLLVKYMNDLVQYVRKHPGFNNLIRIQIEDLEPQQNIPSVLKLVSSVENTVKMITKILGSLSPPLTVTRSDARSLIIDTEDVLTYVGFNMHINSESNPLRTVS